jgi:nucleotide-binding universal stress UspA family protein
MGRARRILQTLAQKFGTHVEIIHVVDYQSADTRSHAEMRATGEVLTRDLRQAGIDATWKLMSGAMGERIVERASEIHADLIIFGLEHVPANPDTIGTISTTIWQAQCPVVTVPGPA